MTDSALPLTGNRVLLEQGVALLEGLSDAQYAGSPGGRPTVGAQYRHVLDHYQAFFRDFASGRVDYDAREREALLEQSRAAALVVTRQCVAALLALEDQPDRALQVQMETEVGAVTPDWRASSAGRELQFLCSHTVHHFALIRLLLAEPAPGLGSGFGVAASTQTHQRGER